MSLTKVPLNAITAKRIGTTANTTSGANVVLLANVAPGSDLTSNTVNLFKGSFVDYEEVFNQAQGASFGYATGGFAPSVVNDIEKYSFTSDANGTDVANLISPRSVMAGTQSTTHGYASGGNPPTTDTIQNFPFSTDSPASDVANLTYARWGSGGQSSPTHGYNSGGEPSPYSAPVAKRIDKFPFSASVNATTVGDLSVGHTRLGGVTGLTHGYTIGGTNSSAGSYLDRFPFSSDENATDVGSLVPYSPGELKHASGHQSLTKGYASGGGLAPGSAIVLIQSWSFATDGAATSVGDLVLSRYGAAGTSSRTHGYSAGGYNGIGSPGYINSINKFPFTSDTNATDIADLSQLKGMAAGQQV